MSASLHPYGSNLNQLFALAHWMRADMGRHSNFEAKWKDLELELVGMNSVDFDILKDLTQAMGSLVGAQRHLLDSLDRMRTYVATRLHIDHERLKGVTVVPPLSNI